MNELLGAVSFSYESHTYLLYIRNIMLPNGLLYLNNKL